jgi:hypothetical protein
MKYGSKQETMAVPETIMTYVNRWVATPIMPISTQSPSKFEYYRPTAVGSCKANILPLTKQPFQLTISGRKIRILIEELERFRSVQSNIRYLYVLECSRRFDVSVGRSLRVSSGITVTSAHAGFEWTIFRTHRSMQSDTGWTFDDKLLSACSSPVLRLLTPDSK